MKKLLAVVAVATGLMLGASAKAVTVDIEFNQTSATDWLLLVDNHGAVGVGAVNIIVSGLNAMTLNSANTAISALDSTLSIDPLGDGVHNWIVINGNAGQAIAPAGFSQVLLATLSGPGPVAAEGSENLVGSDTVFDINGVAITDYSILVHPLPVPEPATLLMLGLGLAGLALVRRTA